MSKHPAKINRAAVLAALPVQYDRATVRIHADGTVTARIDPDVVPGSQGTPRLLAGDVRGILDGRCAG